MDAEDEQAGAGVASSLRLRQKTPAVLVSRRRVAGGGRAVVWSAQWWFEQPIVASAMGR